MQAIVVIVHIAPPPTPPTPPVLKSGYKKSLGSLVLSVMEAVFNTDSGTPYTGMKLTLEYNETLLEQ